MNKLTTCALVMVAGTTLFLAGSAFGRLQRSPVDGAAGRRVLYYVDPMNPAHTSDRPGLAPCGMKMEPVYAGDEPTRAGAMAAVPGAVRVRPEKQQLMGIRVMAAEKVAATNLLRLAGRVVPDERRLFRVNAGVDGYVRTTAITAGSRVRKDECLAVFSAPDARTIIQAFLTAADVIDRQRNAGVDNPAQVSIVSDNYRYAAERLLNVGLSHSQIEEIHKSREVPTDLRIVAPADGVVFVHSLTPGAKFMKGSEWCQLADLSQVWVIADVYPADVAQIVPGAAARITAAGRSDAFTGRVSDVAPQFDPATRALKLRLEVENPDAVLKPDMLVDAVLEIVRPPAIVVAADAVLHSGAQSTVFIDRGDGLFEPRAVRTGWHVGDTTEIVSGLEAGERIVVSSTFLLDSESRMRKAAAGAIASSTIDVVCGMSVESPRASSAALSARYRGKLYLFCSEHCRERFEHDPGEFLKSRTSEAAGNGIAAAR